MNALDLSGLVERLRLRTLVQHGGPKGMSYGWNLTENDSELHRDAAEQLTRLAGERQVLAQWISDALAVLETIDAEDVDEGLGLERLEDAGQALVAAVFGSQVLQKVMDFANLLSAVPDIGDKPAREMAIARLAAAGGAADERAKWRARMAPLTDGQITDAIVQGMRGPVLMRLTGEQVREFVRVIERAHGIEGPNVRSKMETAAVQDAPRAPWQAAAGSQLG